MIHSLKYRLFLNILAYYVIWFSCILSAAHHHSWLGITLSTIIIIIQIAWQLGIRRGDTKFGQLIFNMALCGFLIDSVFMWTHVITYQDNFFTPYFAPPWMILLWIELAIISHIALKGLWQRPLLTAILSLIGFYSAYIAAEALGAAELLLGWKSAAIVGLTWMALLPMLLWNHHKRVLKL